MTTPQAEPRALTWAIITSQFAPPFMFSGVTVALPAMGLELSAGATATGLVETTFLAGTLALVLPMGRLADAADKRTLYKLGLLGFGLSSLLIGVLTSMPLILVIRVLQGMMSAIFASTGPAILAEIVPAERRGRAYGSSIGAAYLGLTLGPVMAGYLVDLAGWRTVFSFGGALLLVGAAIIHGLMPSGWKPLRRDVVHLPSALLWTAAVTLAVAGSATMREGLIAYACLGAAAIGVVVLWAWQLRLPRPLVDVGLLRGSPVLSRALVVQLLLYMCAFASIFMLSLFMQVTLGTSARTAGQVLALGTVLMAVVAPLSGILSDRRSPRAVAIAGVACVLITTLLAGQLDATASLLVVGVVVTVQGLGFALFSTPNMKMIMGGVEPASTGMASALSATSRSIGMVGGMLVTGLLISLSMGHEPFAAHPDRFLVTMLRTYGTFTVIAGLALVIAVLPARRGSGSATEGPSAG